MTAETKKARCVSVSHMILPSVYWLEFRKTWSRWIDELATMEEATLVFRLPESCLPRKRTWSSAFVEDAQFPPARVLAKFLPPRREVT